MNNVGRAIARQLWWAIAHPTSFMLNFRLFYDAINIQHRTLNGVACSAVKNDRFFTLDEAVGSS